MLISTRQRRQISRDRHLRYITASTLFSVSEYEGVVERNKDGPIPSPTALLLVSDRDRNP